MSYKKTTFLFTEGRTKKSDKKRERRDLEREKIIKGRER